MRPQRLLAALVTIFVLVAIPRLVLAEHVPPSATLPAPNEANQASYWDDYFGLADGACEKLNEGGNQAFVMPPAPQGEVWYALVVKQATDNFIYLAPVAGHAYPSVGGQAPGYSHLIVCSVPDTTTSSSTTTEATTSTTTTTPETTTTVESTTITSSPTSTITSTSTTIQESSSTTDPATATLPFTGAGQVGTWTLLASGLLVAGLALLARERQER